MGRALLAGVTVWVGALLLAPVGCSGTETAGPATANRGGSAGATAGSATAGGTPIEDATGADAAAGESVGGNATLGGSASNIAGREAGGRGGGGSAGASANANVYTDELRAREGCLPRPLPLARAGDGLETGQVRCSINLVGFPTGECACDAKQNLRAPSASFAQATARILQERGLCGGTAGPDCEKACICELEQCSGAALTQCQTDTTTAISEMAPGFCYVDALVDPPLGNPSLVASCPTSTRRELRLLGLEPFQSQPLMTLGCW